MISFVVVILGIFQGNLIKRLPGIFDSMLVFIFFRKEEIESLFEGIIFMDKGKIILNEDIDTIDERAFYITGKEEELNDVLRNLNVVSKEKIASLIRLGIYDYISYEEKVQLQNKGFTLEKMPLQKLFVNLLKEGVRSE